MGKRKVNILEQTATSIAAIAFFIEGNGMPQTAKKFVDEVFYFFETLSIDTVSNRPCNYKRWRELGYECVHYKKYVVAYLSLSKEIIICDFISSKLLAE